MDGRMNKTCQEEKTKESAGTIGPPSKRELPFEGSRTTSPDPRGVLPVSA